MSEGGGHKKRGHEEHEEEEHENHERWLVSYADMMTLLMVLFIVLFAISQVDQRKFAQLKTGLSAGFGAPVAIMPGADALLDVGGAVAPDSVNLAGSSGGQARNAQINPQPATKTEQQAEDAASAGQSQTASGTSAASIADVHAQAQAQQQAQEQARAQAEKLLEAQQKLRAALAKSGLAKSASFRFDERGLVVSIATDNVLFASGSAQLEPQGEKILDTLGPTLASLPNRLSIDGHTNSIPISTGQFPSNWELSGGRASGVLRYLHLEAGIPFGRMSETGYADTEPRLPNSNPRALEVNRRVEIVVLAQLDDSAGKTVAEVGNGTGH